MNNRQKAKHFKRLYEATLPQRKRPYFSQSNLKHYKLQKSVSKEFLLGVPEEVFEAQIKREISKEYADLLYRNVVVEDVYQERVLRYSVDIWLKE